MTYNSWSKENHYNNIKTKLSWCWQTRAMPCYIYNRVGRCMAKLLRIFYFQKCSRPPSWIFIFSQFLWKIKFVPISLSSCKIWWRSGDVRPSYCVLSIFKMAAVRHLGFGMTSYQTTHDLFDGPNIVLKLHVDHVNILRYRDFYIWPVWLEIAYSSPFWRSFGVPLGIGYRYGILAFNVPLDTV